MSLISVNQSENTSCFFPNTTFNFQDLLETFELRNEVRNPCFSMIFSMTCFCVSIAFRMCSIFISCQLESTSLTNPARSSARLSIVKLLIQSTFQVFPSVVDTGLKPCNQDYSQETLPGPGQTRIPCFAQAALTPEKIKFEKKSGVRLSEISCRCLQKNFPPAR